MDSSATCTLAEKIAALRAAISGPNHSSDSSSFPLDAALTIYEKASHECMLGDFEGLKRLYAWLTANNAPLALPDIPASRETASIKSKYIRQEYIVVAELSDILSGWKGDYSAASQQRKYIIYTHILRKEILRLYAELL